MVAFIRRCLTALDAPDKLLIFKENTCLFKDYIVDAEDSSVTRSDAVFRRLFAKAGATLVAVEQQRGFPDDLYPVTMYALARAPLFDENDKENDDVRQQQ